MAKRWLELPLFAVPLSWIFWASCVLIVIAWAPIMAAYRLFTFRSDPARRRSGRLHLDQASLAVRVNPFWDFRVAGDAGLDASRACVFVSNHRSNADPFLLSLLPWDMKFVSKTSIFRIPLLGWEMRTAGHIPITRGDANSRSAALAAMRETLLAGASILLFPEGTRSEDGSLGPFREGGFRLAIELGVPIVPLAVRGTERALPKHSLTLRPTSASVTVLPPIATAGLTAADAPALAERARAAIAGTLGGAFDARGGEG
ncbi:MAG TPA: lysophospholipid acyltransferase family protein [Thermoanaerobaculia bacterium]|nr:lysophospholipid acyltransferase family protein [Thermoanaerobaculia bacterium]